MAISIDAKERWRRGIIGRVPIASPRGMVATVLVVLTAAILFLDPAYRLFKWAITGEAPDAAELDRELLVLNLAANAVLLVGFPLLVIFISNPGDWGAPAKRLRLLINRITGLQALLGAAVTVAALLLLGTILAILEQTGLYHAEESELVPQLQALLTPAVIISVPILAAVTEEIYFRGFLQPRVGIIASSILFGLVHSGYGTILQLVAPFALGLLFAYLFQRTRTLWAPIAAHFTFDFIQFLALYFLR